MKRTVASLVVVSMFAWMGGFLMFEGGGIGIPVAHAWPPDPKVDYATLGSPNRPVSGDLDDDGDTDLVITYAGQEYVSVLLNNGNGTYATKVDYRVSSNGSGTYAKDAVIGDFNNDDNVDIATILDNGSGGTSYIVVLPGQGGGTFNSYPSIYQTSWSTGETGSEIAVADLDGDTDLDLVVSNSYYTGNFTIAVFLGNDTGYFSGPTSYHSNVTDGPCYSFVMDDFNGDTADDVVCIANSRVLYWEGNGNGTFDARVSYSVGSQPRGISYGDLDGDTDLDVVVSFQNTGNVGILLNSGSGTFGSVTTYSGGSPNAEMYGLTVADVDGDTNPDVIVPRYYITSTFSYGTQVATLLGNGDGTLGTASTLTTGTAPYDVIATTVNSDAYLDLVVTNYSSNTISVFLNTIPPIENQATVTANVETSASISFGANTVSLGSMTSGAVSADDFGLTVTSNATNGFTIYIDDATDSGYSDGTHEIDMTTGTLSAGTEGAGWSVDVNGTNLAYNGGSCAGNNTVTDIGTTPFAAVVSTEPLSQTYNFCFAAATSSVTPAGTYAHTATVVFVANY